MESNSGVFIMRRAGDQLHVLTGKIIVESANAMKFECKTIDGNEWDPEVPATHWFPFSQITKILKQPKGSNEPDSITVKRWILNTKGII